VQAAPARSGVRHRQVLPIAAAAATVTCGTWALWPLRTEPFSVPSIIGNRGESSPSAAVALDMTPFHAPLWVAPPAPPPPPPAAALPAPLKLQLIAILRDGDAGYRAALYDPDTDKLTIVGTGDSIAGRTIERIGAADLSLKVGGLTRTLSLRTEGSLR
jgi:hypothetical protein